MAQNCLRSAMSRVQQREIAGDAVSQLATHLRAAAPEDPENGIY